VFQGDECKTGTGDPTIKPEEGHRIGSAGEGSARDARQHPGNHRRRQVAYEVVRHLRWPDGRPLPPLRFGRGRQAGSG